MNATEFFAKQELELLKKTHPEATVLPFVHEILSLCKAFGKSGQSGGSAPFTASAITNTIQKLLLLEPICEVTGDEREWEDISELMGKTLHQNTRCSALFKDSTGEACYNNAIVWQGQEDWDRFTGRVYVDDKDFELIGSSQIVKFPFIPKTFILDVVRIPISKEEAEERNLHYIEDAFEECYYTILKDPSQLDEVFKYYVKRSNE